MILSMTGYGKSVAEYEGKRITAEIRSLNSKALDLSTRVAPIYREREMEIRRLACHDTQRQNELSCYQHSQCPIEVMLKKSTAFLVSEPFQLLKADLERFVARVRGESVEDAGN